MTHKMNTDNQNKVMAWLKKVGWVGFFFFLIKGLLWLIVPYLIAKGIWKQ